MVYRVLAAQVGDALTTRWLALLVSSAIFSAVVLPSGAATAFALTVTPEAVQPEALSSCSL